jgi:RES domain
VLPKLTNISQDDTHRLIPTRILEEGETVLSRLGLPKAQMEDLFRLDDATNDRLAGEANLLPHITVHELVFGVPNYHIINAAFSHPGPAGGRFHSPNRGAWYAGFSMKTSQAEVIHHCAHALQEINWREEEVLTYRDYLADFHGEFHDLRGDSRFKTSLHPENYRASQKLANRLLNRGSSGVLYPSVRHSAGTCLACFRPALVTNVREGALVTFTFPDAHHPPKVRVSSE